MRHLAIDLGASGGRHILGGVQEGKLRLTEAYRFENRLETAGGALTWDVERLFQEVLAGLRRCGALGLQPDTLGIDTWGVDYVLLDREDRPLLPIYAYRDGRTDGAPEEVDRLLSPQALYARTGAQRQPFNTIYQLWRDKAAGRLEKAARFLMLPDYLVWRLTGVMANEYTNATTTGLVNARARDWDGEVLAALGLPERLFLPLRQPGAEIGGFTPEVRAAVGYDARVLLAPSHDTASAVAAIPLTGESMYISSGTWSLAGAELPEPVTTEAARQCNFTNEGGVEGRVRFLKNIMGMWLFQGIRRDTNKAYSYDQMMRMAICSRYEGLFDVTDQRLTAPDSMLAALRALLGEPALPLGDVLRSVYRSLAVSYQTVADQLERVTGRPIRDIQIVGGGAADAWLNQITGEYSGRRVYTGMKEATAVGNILSQLMAVNHWDLAAGRALVRRSFDIREAT